MSIGMIISWLIFGCLSAILAKRQGRSPLKWFFIGLVFGIFGLMFIFFAPKTRKEAVPASPSPEPSPSPAPQPNPDTPVLFWYYLDADKNQHGPMSKTAFEAAKAEGKINDTSYVWNTDMDVWKRLSELTIPS